MFRDLHPSISRRKKAQGCKVLGKLETCKLTGPSFHDLTAFGGQEMKKGNLWLAEQKEGW